MSNKKNIERLFQEKFRDFEVEPPSRVWINIETKLNGKKVPKIIPLWWKVSGIAAALILGSLISLWLLNSANENVILDNRNSVTIQENNTIENNSNNIPTINNKTDINSKSIKSTGNTNNSVNQKNATTNFSGKNHNNNSTLKLKNSFNATKNAVVYGVNKGYFKQKSKNKIIQPINNEIILEKNNEADLTNSILDNKEDIQNNMVVSTKDIVQKDTVLNAVVTVTEPNPLEKLLKEKETKTTADAPKAKLKKWQVSSNAAPVYYNSVSQGSPLDIEFKNNSKDYKTNLGYGIGVKYVLNKKWSVKTGANSVAMEYNTNNVLFSQESFSNSINNLNTNLEGSFLQIQTRNVSFANSDNKFAGQLNQKMGYLEVPLELSYKIIDRKFGIDIIGGFSTLFLNENRVSLLSSGLELNIGEANNLRSIHYSTNIGLGFKYNFWKTFQANFDPIFKYQINTFSSDDGNFKPFIMGLYTGVSYSF